jgi:hypothetical protein
LLYPFRPAYTFKSTLEGFKETAEKYEQNRGIPCRNSSVNAEKTRFMNTKGLATATGGKRNRDARDTAPAAVASSPIRLYLWFLLFLLGILLVLFHPALLNPDLTQFSNDLPLGVYKSNALQLPGGFSGIWLDLNSIGMGLGTSSVIFSNLLRWGCIHFGSVVWFAKFFPPITLFFLGSCAWLFFRSLKLSPMACLLGGLAVALNSGFFSATCWGIGTQEIGVGYDFLALAAVASSSSGKRWLKLILAGFAVGMGIMEGVDVGALLSMLVAAFVMLQALVEGVSLRNFFKGVARTAVVTVFAVFIATQALSSLIDYQIKNIAGITGSAQDARTKAERWDWATTWSFPKRETLSLFIPGLFGYRMDTPDGGNYWGAMGRDPAWDRYFANGEQGPAPQGAMRFTGGGAYNGVLVMLIAIWAALQAFRKNESVFSPDQRKNMWFWTALAVFTLLISYGRFAPFYRLVYSLPYFSTIRNPCKFIMFFDLAVLILFAYGVHGLGARYLSGTVSTLDLGTRVKNWWRKAAAFDKRWVAGCFITIAASLAGWMIFATSRSSFEHYLQTVGFEPPLTESMAAFSIHQVGWYILFLVVSVIAMILVFSGTFAGKRAKWAGLLLGLIVVADLVRANDPWVKYVDFKNKNEIGVSGGSTNPLIEMLREKPYEHRVAMMPLREQDDFTETAQLYRIEWAQHQFQYYNIQSLDIVQMSRMAQDLAAFQAATVTGPMTRRWELTNTRYLLGPAVWIVTQPDGQKQGFPFLEALNQQIDPEQHRFRTLGMFNLAAKPVRSPYAASRLEIETVEAGQPKNGAAIALYEFAGALPRARLFANWRVSTNTDPAALAEWVKKTGSLVPAEWANALASLNATDQSTLKEMMSPEFKPAQTVLLAKPLPLPAANATNQDAGSVEFLSYAPKDIKLKAVANTPAVLLLNDKYDPTWQVRVDGKPAELLRCNFVMRGVAVQPGEHTVEFIYQLDPKPMYVSIAGIGVALLLTGFLAVSSFRRTSAAPGEPLKQDAPNGKPK